MEFAGKTVVVTGGASGIGAALVARFDGLGARIFVIDQATSAPAGQTITCDVSDADAFQNALRRIQADTGGIDIFVSNAGVFGGDGHVLGSAEDWQRCWEVNVLAHVYAAHVLIPEMVKRGSGHFVIVASAAGLLNQIGDAPYSATKHAAVSFAESLAISYGNTGLGVSVVCPQYVATPLIGLTSGEVADGVLSADEVARITIDAIAERRFLILPHPEVQNYAMTRARDHDSWIDGMGRLRARALDRFGEARPETVYKLI